MFGLVLAVVAVGTFAALAAASALQGTAAKIQAGDTVKVPVTGLALVDGASAVDQAALTLFLAGFSQQQATITNVVPAAGTDFGIGSIIGLSPPVKFHLSAVTSIVRNGTVIT